jgi:hypothetical protein
LVLVRYPPFSPFRHLPSSIFLPSSPFLHGVVCVPRK